MIYQRKLRAVAFVSAALLSPFAAAAAPLTVFETDFSGGLPSAFSGQGAVVDSEGYDGVAGFSGSFLQNRGRPDPEGATYLTVDNLPTHSSISLDFVLGVIDSWDGESGEFGPDFFTITLDGDEIFSGSFANPSFGSTAPQSIDPELRIIDPTHLGFNERWEDTAYDLSPLLQDIAHTGDSALFAFYAMGAGWQAGADESFALDNVRVSVDGVGPGVSPVPLPMTAWLLTGSLGGLALLKRKRRKD